MTHNAGSDVPFQSRYGQEYDGTPKGCPDGMYPWDVDYAEQAHATFDEFKAHQRPDSLNLPISWYFNPADEGGEFVLVYVMPRKYGKTWSVRLAPGFDRAEVEAWLEDWTHEVAAQHYGWTSVSPPEQSTP
jgi:hypothetical protein